MKTIAMEFWARMKYNFFCLVLEDGTWSMGAVLIGSPFPFAGKWVNTAGVFNTYKEMEYQL